MRPSKKRKNRDLVIMANRLPVRRATVDGRRTWVRSPGGLVSAVAPIVEDRSGAWVGWAGTSGAVPKPFTVEGISNVPVKISRSELSDYYQGQCNSTLWPLYHDAIREPEYHRHWWASYVAVNRRFAEAAAEIAAPGGLVWIHDYHLQLAPAMLRDLRSDVTIGFFLHIPFPPRELFRRLPWRREILQGLLGSDVVGFQTRAGTTNFLNLASRLTEASRRRRTVHYDGRTIRAGTFPISIDVDRFQKKAREPEVLERAREIRESLGGGRKLILGVDRLDYTKGIDLRLKAFAEWLERTAVGDRDAVLVQVAVPSREQVADYQELRSQVEELVGQINGEYAEVGKVVVHYLRRNLPFDELVAMYRAADVMVVTPLCDGMNLVAKEYVVSKVGDSGVLVLSEFAGAADELRSALTVNPHDVDGLAETLHKALHLPAREASRRLRAMTRAVRRNTVYDWAGNYLDVLSN